MSAPADDVINANAIRHVTQPQTPRTMKNTVMKVAQAGVLSRTSTTARYRRFLAAVLCGAAIMMSVLSIHAAPSTRSRKAAKECRANYDQELTKLQSLPLAVSEKQTRTIAAYDDLAACLRANHMLSMLPKRPAAATLSGNQPASRTGMSAAPSPTPAPKKKAWITRPASQTGSHL